jgi:hypothetical protein
MGNQIEEITLSRDVPLSGGDTLHIKASWYYDPAYFEAPDYRGHLEDLIDIRIAQETEGATVTEGELLIAYSNWRPLYTEVDALLEETKRHARLIVERRAALRSD